MYHIRSIFIQPITEKFGWGFIVGLLAYHTIQYMGSWFGMNYWNDTCYLIISILGIMIMMGIGMINPIIMQRHKQKKLVISIEGNIGSGKSTLIKYLKEHLPKRLKNDPIIFLPEPVAEWETIRDIDGKSMLENFYEDKKKYSFPFQIMAYATRLSLIYNAVRNNPNSIIITERCLRTDKHVFLQMLYDTDLIEQMMYQIYTKLFDIFSNDYEVDRTIYISTRPDVCYDRIVTRNRMGENNISIEYLNECMKYHEMMMSDTIRTNKMISPNHLILDGNIDCHKNTQQLDIWMDQIIQFIRN